MVIGSVSRPGQIGAEPVNAFHGLKLVMSVLPNERSQVAAGDTLGELAMQIGGAAGAGSAVGELLKLAEELRTQGLALFRPGRLHRRLALRSRPFQRMTLE